MGENKYLKTENIAGYSPGCMGQFDRKQSDCNTIVRFHLSVFLFESPLLKRWTEQARL